MHRVPVTANCTQWYIFFRKIVQCDTIHTNPNDISVTVSNAEKCVHCTSDKSEAMHIESCIYIYISFCVLKYSIILFTQYYSLSHLSNLVIGENHIWCMNNCITFSFLYTGHRQGTIVPSAGHQLTWPKEIISLFTNLSCTWYALIP